MITLLYLTGTAWKVSKYGVISGQYFSVSGLNTEICWLNLRIQSEYRKIRTKNNSVFGQFSRSVDYSYSLSIQKIKQTDKALQHCEHTRSWDLYKTFRHLWHNRDSCSEVFYEKVLALEPLFENVLKTVYRMKVARKMTVLSRELANSFLASFHKSLWSVIWCNCGRCYDVFQGNGMSTSLLWPNPPNHREELFFWLCYFLQKQSPRAVL